MFLDAASHENPLDAALAYARAGCRVVPVNSRKQPLIKEWQNVATTDETTIREWWAEFPFADVGWTLPRAIVVVDCDSQNGLEAFAKILGVGADQLDGIAGLVAVSPRGGRHFYFPNDGLPCKGWVEKLAVKTDIRTIGNLVVLPHSGNGRRWSKVGEFLAMPPKLAEALRHLWERSTANRTAEGVEQPFAGTISPYAQKALDNAIDAIRAAAWGSQEQTLNNEALGIGGLVKGGHLPNEETRAALIDAALAMKNQPGRRSWTRAQIEKKIDKAFRDATARTDKWVEGEKQVEEWVTALDKAALDATQERKRGNEADYRDPPSHGPDKAPVAVPPPQGKPFPLTIVDRQLKGAVGALIEKREVPAALAGGICLSVASLAATAVAEVVLPFQPTLSEYYGIQIVKQIADQRAAGDDDDGDPDDFPSLTDDHPDPGEMAEFARLWREQEERNETVAPLNQYHLIGAPSGERKSVAIKDATEGIRRAEEMLKLAVEPARDAHALAVKLYEKGLTRAKNEKDPTARETLLKALVRPGPPPPRPDLIVNDFTIQGLYHSLNKGPDAQMFMTAEAGTFVSGYAMTEKTQGSTMGGLNGIWDGGANKGRRADEARNYDVEEGKRACLCLVGQPVMVRRVSGSRLADEQGFLARFLMCEPESVIGVRRLNDRPLLTQKALTDFNDNICAMMVKAMPADHLRGAPRRRLRMTVRACQLFRDFANEMERGMRPNGDLKRVSGFANKAAEHAARIAGCFAAFNDHDEIDRPTMADAVEIVRFYLNEQLRLSGLPAPSDAETDARDLLVWLRTKWGEKYFCPSNAVGGPARMRAYEPRKAAIDHLLAIGAVARVPGERLIRGKNRREVYAILPDQGDD
jgi:hypothetical protein